MQTIILRLPPKMLIKFRLGRVARAARRARREALERKAARDRAAELIDDQNYLSQVFLLGVVYADLSICCGLDTSQLYWPWEHAILRKL